MARIACVHISSFPLQLLLKQHPDWASRPVAVVAEEKPQAAVLCVNEKARGAGIFPGMRFAAAASLTHQLRAAAVSAAEIEREAKMLRNRLVRFSPQVEPSREEPGVFWLSIAGFRLLYPSLQDWARTVRADIQAQGFDGSVAAGWTRFGTYAAAKVRRGITVFEDCDIERAATGEIPLDALNLDCELRETLLKLGIKTVGAFLGLPPGGLYERFGAEAYRLYRMAAGESWTALRPEKPEIPVAQKIFLDEPEAEATRLLFLIKSSLHPMLN
ncbi:MAG TPA: hypothetical protein VNL14_15285, partial [Candidatus Acidoferrales bacterium]|nr:hypothetical protein [Candidatus Acidoferrales bacterium]